MKTPLLLQATSPLAAWLHHLEHLHFRPIDLGLDRVLQVARRLDLLRPAATVFTVGGTNGKGTTCRTLECLLLAAGYRVGVYSSPHLTRYTERVRIQGAELNEEAHVAAFAAIEAARETVSLTYFEFGTLAALWLFKRAAPDVAILEVGLGGRLDATNIVDADVATIVSIGLDHTDWLGNSRESIGREKAGIFRRGKAAVVGEPDMPRSIAQAAAACESVLLQVGQQWRWQARQNGWCFEDQHGVLEDLPLPAVPLPNAATALASLRACGLTVDEQLIRRVLPAITLPGRFQIITGAPRIILDVAHNPHAAAYLSERLGALEKQGKVLAVVGMLHDKDIAGTLANLAPQVDQWFCASLNGARGATAAQLLSCLPANAQATAFADVEAAWRSACLNAKPQDIILVCGSFHTVAQCMATMETEKSIGK